MPNQYLAFYKPFRVLSQFTSEGGRPAAETLAPFIAVPGVYAAGRLDYDSEGLLLLTDDGRLQHRLTDPRFEHPRTYWVQVEGIANAQAAEKLENGVSIRDYRTRPCSAALIPEPALAPRQPPVRVRREIPTSWLSLTLIEGRNRQVRRMTAAVGLPTLRLVRAAIGAITIDQLQPGQWRRLSSVEVDTLKRSVGA